MRFTPGTVREANGAVPVNIQDQHTRALDLEFLDAYTPWTTLAAPTVLDAWTITVTDPTNYADGRSIAVFTASGDEFSFFHQVGAPVGNVVTLDRPMDVVYPAGANTFAAEHHLNVDGSITPRIFQIGPIQPAGGIEIDITRVMGYIEDATVMDDSKFGGMSALTNGVTLRLNNGIMSNLWNVKTNGEIALLVFDTEYTLKSPAGFYGYRFRNTYAGPSKHGVTLRLMPGDTLEAIISDDLTDLTDFRLMAQGHLVGN